MLRQIFRYAIRRGLHAVFSGFPVRRADLAVFLRKLKRVEHAKRLRDVPAQWQVVDDGVPDHAILVYEEQPAQGDGIIEQHA